MDQRIFEQLDRLERGARIDTRPQPQANDDSSADYSAFGSNDTPQAQQTTYYGVPSHEDGPLVAQPFELDSFDEQLLRQPDYDSRHEQALLGNTRITLPHPGHSADPVPRTAGPAPMLGQRPDLSRFAFEGAPQGQSSSSPFNQPLRSSPAFRASQRCPAPLEKGRHEPSFHHSNQNTAFDQPPHYRPVTAQDIDAEIEECSDENADPIAPRIDPPRSNLVQPAEKRTSNTIGPPIVQGIDLVPTSTLPDRFRALFPYPLFNAVQSKCFNTLYKTSDNFVLSAPTGSGKTAALELAICRLINSFANGSYKIVYQAPTKSLCAERCRDWQAKFGPLDLQCVELTGDTDNVSQRNVQHATIIITTPEKWDGMTRKWKDQQKLMRMVKLFLIDEVHILKEDRGATLEAVVSRMKSVGSDVRFIALSATVPNSEDIAVWLGKDPMNPDIPSPRERFGEEFRPVKLQKHVVGYRTDANDFAFDKALNGKLPEVIAKYSQRKPIMVFCFTRPSCVETAKVLSNWWATKGPAQRHWSQPRHRVAAANKDLADTLSSGVAFHHAGLTTQDRTAVEKAYLRGEVSVICCTSTLAVGVNLPCHMVIIKNTVSYQSIGCKEYSDLETMQMLGRAGRPQFDDSAVAVVMTKLQKVSYYEKMITGQEVLESCLHRNLIDHLNAEIGLGTITNASSAKKWLSSTFLYVRLKENPEHYKIDGDTADHNLDGRLDNFCTKGIALLEANDLVNHVPKLHCTEFGDAMARYCLQFDTMKIFLALPPKAKTSEILSVLSQAAEFRDVRFRAGEKPVYRDLNKNNSVKFPLPGTLDTPAHKISIVIQSVLGCIDFPSEDYKLRSEYATSKSVIFNNVSRLIRCIIDCQLYLEDAVAARNALSLARSLGAQVWDDSPLHIKQLDGIGAVYLRKLVGAGIKSIDDLVNTDARRIETALSRNPPFGTQLLDKAKAFPKLRVSIQVIGEPIVKKGEHIALKMKAEIGFLNDNVPTTFQRKPLYICLLAETSDGRMVHFARIGAKKLDRGQDVLFSANLTSATQSVHAYVMCDEIAGTMRHASLKPEIPAIAFPPPKTAADINQQRSLVTHAPNSAKRRASANALKDEEIDEFGDAGLDDADLAEAETKVFMDIDDFDDPAETVGQPPKKKQKTSTSTQANFDWQPTQLDNGKWACKHPCKDKTQCKHLCCREGLDKKPKASKAASDKKAAELESDPKQTQLDVSVTKKSAVPSTAVTKSIEKPDSTQPRKKTGTKEPHGLEKLHQSVPSKTPKVPTLGQGKAGGSHQGGQSLLSFLQSAGDGDDGSTDYGADPFEWNDLPSLSEIVGTQAASRMSPPELKAGTNYADDEMLDDSDGNDDGRQLSQSLGQGNGDGYVGFSTYTNEDAVIDGKPPGVHHDEHDDFFATTSPPTQCPLVESKPVDKDSHLLVGYSTDFAANDLGLSHPESKEHSGFEGTSAPTASKFFSQPSKVQRRPPSAQLREEERLHAAIPPDAFAAEIDEALAVPSESAFEKESSPDSLKKWVMEEFGTENFNMTW